MTIDRDTVDQKIREARTVPDAARGALLADLRGGKDPEVVALELAILTGKAAASPVDRARLIEQINAAALSAPVRGNLLRDIESGVPLMAVAAQFAKLVAAH